MNAVHLTGNFVRDPELRQTKTGVSVLDFTIAVNESHKKKDGSVEKRVSFILCEAWDTGAQRIAENFKKGDAILVNGKLREHIWEPEEGQKRSKLKVRVDNFEFIKRKRLTTEQNVEPQVEENSEDLPF